MHIRGAEIEHSTLQRWVKRFGRLISDSIRSRKKPVNGSWRMDGSYIKLNGKWAYLYRAVDKEGNTIDFFLITLSSKTIDLLRNERDFQVLSLGPIDNYRNRKCKNDTKRTNLRTN